MCIKANYATWQNPIIDNYITWYNPIITNYAMWHVSIDQCGDIIGCLNKRTNETSSTYYLFHWRNMVTNKFY